MLMESETSSSSTEQSVNPTKEWNTTDSALYNYTSDDRNFVTTDIFTGEPTPFVDTALTNYHKGIHFTFDRY